MKENISEVVLDNLRDSECRNPIQLKNGYIKRCKSQEYVKCPPCSIRYMRESQVLMWAGIPDEENSTEYFWVFYTLTAPSFNLKPHNVPKQKNRGCSACGEFHDRNFADVGVPVDITTDLAVDVEDSRFYELVRFNQNLPGLLNNTMDRIQRRFPGVAYMAVQEWQKRLAVHSHVLFRVPMDFASDEFIDYLNSLGNGGVKCQESHWGFVDSRLVGGELDSNTRYLSKALTYTRKAIQASVRALETSPARFMYEDALTAAASNLKCNRNGCDGGGDCSGKCHREFGFTGYKMRKSRNWVIGDGASTRRELQEQRIEWARSHRDSQEHMDTEQKLRLIYAANNGVDADALFWDKIKYKVD